MTNESKICAFISEPKKHQKCLKEKCRFWIDKESKTGMPGIIFTRYTELRDMCIFEALVQLLMLLNVK